MIGGIEWQISQVHSITDGDTLRVSRRRTENLDDHSAHDIYDRPDVHPKGVSIRVITIDTPEKNEPGPWRHAKLDAETWVMTHIADGLQIMTWADGGFSRFLGDVYYIKDGVHHSLTEYMLTEGNNGEGWPIYQRGQ
jgi:endonuclease YncB( thermonuclease family)